MKRINKHGATYQNIDNNIRKLTCSDCGCVFEYDIVDDIEIDHETCYTDYVRQDYFIASVSCPECYNITILGKTAMDLKDVNSEVCDNIFNTINDMEDNRR